MHTHADRPLRKIKCFADDAGVSVRTLHLYDRLGLLKPAAVTESGYRLYGEEELERLEHILALRFVGFNLEQIKELLHGSNRPLSIALRMQRDVIAREKRRLDFALAAIDEAERALAKCEVTERWQILRKIIEVFMMENDWSWTQNYYSEEAREKIDARRRSTPKAVIEQGERDWAALLADVEEATASGVDPSSAQALALAERWRALVAQFTQGDPEIARGLNRLWSDTAHRPRDFKRPWSDEADAFIKKALNCESSGGAVDGD
ncbi:MAG TPA: MerR family transcriptional regulator [Candidatus Binatia bacterium]|nr:MerR family transcriptional regulator [Candidatus Binatia bacterium]